MLVTRLVSRFRPRPASAVALRAGGRRGRPAANINKALLRAISRSPFLRDARRRHQAREKRFERLAR